MIVAFLQKLGKALMIAVSIMPVAAILKGIGYWLEPNNQHTISLIALLLVQTGSAVIDNLPFFFAIAIAIAFAKDKSSIVVISVVVAYVIYTHLLSVESVALFLNVSVEHVPKCYMYSSNALMGIVLGGVSAFLYNHFHSMQLPSFLAFFNGKRFVPIVTSVVVMLISFIFIYVWPIIFSALEQFGRSIALLGPFGAGVYGFFNRLLVATGLHHALNTVFWFDGAGIADIGKFWGSVPGGVVGVTGMYQAGFFPVMMFGLPAAALAIYRCAREENKKKIKSILISGALASFLTGVTEPLEFSFMFVAPVLFVVHALLTAIMMMVAATFQWIAGFGFSAGFIDFVLSVKSPFAHQPLMLLVLGVGCGIVYYALFRFFILRYNLMTIGREVEQVVVETNKEENHVVPQNLTIEDMAILYVEALGGMDNIVEVDSCITRLRVQLKTLEGIDEQRLLAISNASGVVKTSDHSLQIIVGTQVQFIADCMNEILM